MKPPGESTAIRGVALLTIAFFLFAVFAACGVRGKPQPPLTPAELGRGKPTFRRGTEEFAFPAVPTPSSVPDRKPTPAEHEDNG